MKPIFSKYIIDGEGNEVLTECPANEATHIHKCYHDEEKFKPCKVIVKGSE